MTWLAAGPAHTPCFGEVVGLGMENEEHQDWHCAIWEQAVPGYCLVSPMSLLLHVKMSVRDKHIWMEPTVICVVLLYTHRGKERKSGQ